MSDYLASTCLPCQGPCLLYVCLCWLGTAQSRPFSLWLVGPGVLSQQHSRSEASEDAESVASQLQPLRSGELQAQVSVPDLNELEGGSMMALPKEPSRQSVASGYGPPVTRGQCAAMQPSIEL